MLIVDVIKHCNYVTGRHEMLSLFTIGKHVTSNVMISLSLINVVKCYNNFIIVKHVSSNVMITLSVFSNWLSSF